MTTIEEERHIRELLWLSRGRERLHGRIVLPGGNLDVNDSNGWVVRQEVAAAMKYFATRSGKPLNLYKGRTTVERRTNICCYYFFFFFLQPTRL